MNIVKNLFNWLTGQQFIMYLGGGGGGGGGTTQSTNTTYQTNIPEYAKPYVETMLGATQKQLFQGTPTEGGGFDITGFQPYRAYGGTYDEAGNQTSYDPSKGIADFKPMQTNAQQGIANMQVPGEFGAAAGATQYATQRAMGANYNPSSYGSQFNPQGIGYGAQNAQAANLGYAPMVSAGQYGTPMMDTAQTGYSPGLQNFQMGPAERVNTQSFAQPGAADAYMSPYMQSVVDIQKREAQRQSGIQGTQQQAQAAQAGAFGGSRDAIQRAERERNLSQQMGDIQAQGSQAAYSQAQQQFNAEQQARLAAQQANQQAGLTTGGQNLSAALGVQQLGAQTGLQTSLANLSSAQQANVQNQAAQLQTQGMNAQQAMQAALANQQMAGQYGLQQGQLSQQANLANQAAQNQAGQFNAGQNLQAASLGAQYGQAANQLNEQSRQYGAGYGLQGLQTGLQGANQLANIGQQQLASQQGIYGLQNQYGAQQQALEQQKINQAVQDYSNAQQYPLMQLGTMSNMLRGLPMQAQTTQQYVAAPNPITQAIGAAGAGASLYNAFKGAGGGLPSEFKKSGIMSYAEGGEVDAIDIASKMATIANVLPRIGFSAGGISNDIEHDLYSMDEDDLQRQLKESSSPSVKRMAQRILRMKQMENQPQQPGMAGGGIIAFGEGELVPPPTSSEILQQRVMQGKPTGDVMTQPQGIVQAPAPTPKTALEATQADPNIPDVLKSQISDIQARANRSIPEIMKERQAAYEAAGVAQRNPEERANLMQERANAEDEAKRNRYLQAAAFFARWGSTPGSTLAAGLTAVREQVPQIVENEKEARNIRMQINKSISNLDEATRLEEKGRIDEATAIKEKDAAKMQDLYLKLSDYEMQAKREEAKAQRDREHMTSLERMRKDIADSQNATHLAIADMQTKAERARIAASTAERGEQAKWGQLQGIYKSSESAINGINDMRNRKDYTDSKTIVDRAEALRSLNPEGKLPPQFEQSYPKALAKINGIEQEIKDRKDRIQNRVNVFEKRIFGDNFDMNSDAPKATPGNRPQVKGNAARGGQPRPEIESFYTR